jgi:hypothetical protein
VRSYSTAGAAESRHEKSSRDFVYRRRGRRSIIAPGKSDCADEVSMEIMIAGLVLVLGAVTYLIYRLAATLQERK